MNRIAKFEKVSLEQFREGWTDTFGPVDEGVIEGIYGQIRLPGRATAGSAGYDFFAPADFVLEPGETVKIPTGIRVWMEPVTAIIWPLVKYLQTNSAVCLQATTSIQSVWRSVPARA